jgi:release factor glutamine methyltransferase
MNIFKNTKKSRTTLLRFPQVEMDELSNYIFGKPSSMVEETELIEKHSEIERVITLLLKHTPVAYIVGEIKIGDIKVMTPKGKVLIPRVETEKLCELAITAAKEIQSKNPEKQLQVLDVGTGSGYISIYLNKKIDADLTAIDISSDAIEVAKENFKLNNVDDVELIQSSIKNFSTTKKFDLIVSNPPYIPIKFRVRTAKSVKNYEPNIALYGNGYATEVFEDIVKFAKKNLTKNGILVFEVFSKMQATRIITFIREYHKFLVPILPKIEKDVFGEFRYLVVKFTAED